VRGAATGPGLDPFPDRRSVAIRRVEVLGWSLIAVHAAILVATGAVAPWGWGIVAVLVGVTVPALAGLWIVEWGGRAALLAVAGVLVVASGDDAAAAAWMWLMLAVAGPALRGGPAVATISTALLTATTASTLAATGQPWSLVAPATAAVLFFGALARGLADSVRDAHGAFAAFRSRERRFGALLRDAAEAIVIVGPDRSLQFVSPAITRVLGHRDDAEPAEDWLELAHPDDRAVVLQMATRVRAMPGETVTGELRLRHADGHHVWVRARVVDLTANPDVGGLVVAFHDITDEKAAASDERLRISRELHDSVSQALFSMGLQARTAQLELTRAGVDEHAPLRRAVDDVAELARGALAEIRALIFELRPRALTEEGFVSAVRKHAAAVGARHRVDIAVDAPAERIVVGALAEEHLFRIVQEAVGNAARHADASRIAVRVATTSSPTWITVTVGDDGRGFDPAGSYGGHFGLQTMRERVAVLGGRLEIDSRPGEGTVVAVAVPATGDRADVAPLVAEPLHEPLAPLVEEEPRRALG